VRSAFGADTWLFLPLAKEPCRILDLKILAKGKAVKKPRIQILVLERI